MFLRVGEVVAWKTPGWGFYVLETDGATQRSHVPLGNSHIARQEQT